METLVGPSSNCVDDMDLSKLLSPPESTAPDPFSPPRHRRPSSPGAMTASSFLKPDDHRGRSNIEPHAGHDIARLPSPPVTPANRPMHRRKRSSPPPHHSGSIKDPVLFAHHEPDSILAHDQPLFPDQTPAVVAVDPKWDAIVARHMATHAARFRNAAHKPTRDEYLLALSCIPIVSKRYADNPRRWLQQERRILDERFGGANRVWKRPAHLAGLAKIAPAPIDAYKRPSVTPRLARPPRAPRAPRPSRPVRPVHGADALDGETMVPSPRRLIGTSREDTDFAALPDYAPALSTLPTNNPKILKADWRGQALDLSADPHAPLLHEAELHLAATLRLSCATYLCSKRRIFMARLEALRIGKEFRKTDSQQACKIDVNKASKLWTAYERVGWFKPEHFRRYLG